MTSSGGQRWGWRRGRAGDGWAADVPLNADAVCADTPTNCGTRVTGTIVDFTTGEPLPGATLVVASALQAVTNPTGAMAIVVGTSAANGRVDETTADPIMAPIATPTHRGGSPRA